MPVAVISELPQLELDVLRQHQLADPSNADSLLDIESANEQTIGESSIWQDGS